MRLCAEASLIMLPILIASIVIVWYRSWAKANWYVASFSLLSFLGLLLYAYQGGSADTDVLWASFLMLSYMVLPKEKTSDILFALSLSVKQLPFLIAPFLLYYIYREYGPRKTLTWILAAAGSFFLINGYFIIQNPGYWFSSMMANEFAPLIRIGFGVPQISFSGLFFVPRIYFTVVMIDLFLLSLMFYVIKYRHINYGIFIFPMIIFIFNYRLFPQYLYYWMMVSLLPMIDTFQKKSSIRESVKKVVNKDNSILRKRNAKLFLLLFIVFIISNTAFVYNENTQYNYSDFTISSIYLKNINTNGLVNEIVINISYHGNENQTNVFFRIFPNSPIINDNMLLWTLDKNITLRDGITYNLAIYPEYSLYSVNASKSFVIVAYYDNV